MRKLQVYVTLDNRDSQLKIEIELMMIIKCKFFLSGFISFIFSGTRQVRFCGSKDIPTIDAFSGVEKSWSKWIETLTPACFSKFFF